VQSAFFALNPVFSSLSGCRETQLPNAHISQHNKHFYSTFKEKKQKEKLEIRALLM